MVIEKWDNRMMVMLTNHVIAWAGSTSDIERAFGNLEIFTTSSCLI